MAFFYNMFFGIYVLGAYILAPFNKKIRKFVLGRNGVISELKKKIKKEDKIVWFHAASLGEFEQGRPVIEALKKERPELKILLSFFSPSGYEIRKNYGGADFVCYLPFDFYWQAHRFVKTVNPVAAYFIKYEFWHHLIHELYRNKTPIYSISAIFRSEQVFFKWYGGWYRELLKKFTAIFVQNAGSDELLRKYNITHTFISGDTRFDRVNDIAQCVKQIPVVEEFSKGVPTIIAGSSWPADEDLLVRYINETQNNCKIVFAPHEIPESGIEHLFSILKVPAIRFSQAENKNLSDYKVLVIDNIGMLSSIYQYGVISYIGGGFGKGIHNTLEAATFGLPVIFGPNYLKFKEAVDLINLKGAFSITDFNQLKEILDILIENKERLANAGAVCKNYVSSNTGATQLILGNIGY